MPEISLTFEEIINLDPPEIVYDNDIMSISKSMTTNSILTKIKTKLENNLNITISSIVVIKVESPIMTFEYTI